MLTMTTQQQTQINDQLDVILAQMHCITGLMDRFVDNFDVVMALGQRSRELSAEFDALFVAVDPVGTFSAAGLPVPDWVADEYGLPAGVAIEIGVDGDDMLVDGLTGPDGAWLNTPAELADDLYQRVAELLEPEHRTEGDAIA